MSAPTTLEREQQGGAPTPPAAPARTGDLATWARSGVTFFVFLAIFAGLSLWLGGLFLSPQDRIYDFHQNVPLILIAFAAVTILAVGQFDLSIGAIATLSAYLSIGLYVNQGIPLPIALVICLAVGALAGLVNALLVVKMEINAFIVTIGTGGVFLGISRVYSSGTVLIPEKPLPSWFSGRESLANFSTKVPDVVMWLVLAGIVVTALLRVARVVRSRQEADTLAWLRAGVAVLVAVGASALWPKIVGLVPMTVLFVVLVSFVMWLTLTRTVFGRYLYATGGNARAARLAGVKTDRQTTLAFVLTGVLSALGGMVLAANQGTVAVDAAQPSLLPAYAAAFLSTVLLSSGRLHIWGCLLGALFVVWIRQALIIGGVQFTWAEIVNGGVLVAAVAASRLLSRGRKR